MKFSPTLLLALSALFSRILGVFRDHLLAKTFGAAAGTGIYDLNVYYAAFRIPDMIYTLLVFGTVSAAFIPIFTQYKKNNDSKNSWEFASSMLHLMSLAVIVIAAAMYALAPFFARLTAGGFSANQLELTVKLMRIMLISPILFSLTSVLVSIQDSFKAFFFRSLGPLFYNLGIIGGIIYFGTKFGILGVTWGVIIGALLQLLIQLPSLKLVGFRHLWILGIGRSDVREAFSLMAPRVLGLSLTQMTLIINTMIASFLPIGSIAIFYLADNLNALPLGMIGIAFAITSFAALSELAGEPDKKPFAKELRRVTEKILFLIIPATIGMFILRDEIIGVILVYGKFTAEDAFITSKVLSALLISLFAQSLIPTLARGFYALRDTKTPLFTGFAGAAVSIGGSLILAMTFNLGITGIALAYSAGNIVNFILLYILISRKTAGADERRLKLIDPISTSKTVFYGALMGGCVYFAKIMIPFGGGAPEKIGLLAVYTVIGAGVYFGAAFIFRLTTNGLQIDNRLTTD